MYQQGLDSVADGCVLRLGIDGDAHGFFQVGVFIYVHMADAVGVSHDGDFGVVHDVLHEFIAAARDDQVDEVV